MNRRRNDLIWAATAALWLAVAGVARAANSGWTVVSSPSPSNQNWLFAVSGTSASDVWAVGSQFDANDNQTVLAEHFDGAAWTVFPTPNPGTTDCAPFWQNAITGVYAASSDDVWAVGNRCVTTNIGGNYQTLIEHWDGASWSVIPSPNKAGSLEGSILTAVTGLSSDDVWAAGNWAGGTWPTNQGGALIEHWDGTKWSIIPCPSGSKLQEYAYLTGIAEVSPTDVWAVGSNGNPGQGPLIEHYDGASWSIVSSPFSRFGGADELLGVTAISANDVWAVGYANQNSKGQTGQGLIQHWDGTKWSLVNSPIAGYATDLYGISAMSSTDAWAVGYVWSPTKVTPVTEHWNGTQWTIVTPSDPGKAAELLGSANVSGTVWAVGAYSTQSGNGLHSAQTLTMKR